jgi:hypothetical protein
VEGAGRQVAAPAKTLLPAMREKLGVKLEQATIGGVNVFVLTPQTIAPKTKTACSYTSMAAPT